MRSLPNIWGGLGCNCETDSGSGDGSGTSTGIAIFASIPIMIASDRTNYGFALCMGGYVSNDGNLSAWVNTRTNLLDTPRLPNGTSIVTTAGELVLWRISLEEFLGSETVIIPPGGMPFEAAYNLTYPTLADFLNSTFNGLVVVFPDANGVAHTWIKEGVAGTAEQQNLSWAVNAGGYIFQLWS